MKNLIIRLNDINSLQVSPEGVKINKIVSSISPANFIKLLKRADNKVNPRIAKVNRITKSIHETLDTSPELMWLKSKGILLATESCKLLDRNRIEISLEKNESEGIMDGGHNTFAIAIYLIEKLYDGKKIKKWEECKAFWDENYDDILTRYQEREHDFGFSIPIEIITPNDEDGAIDQYYDYISEICSARNNNVQLTETAKANQVGHYDYLKQELKGFDVIWKSGDSGTIKSEDVISLATLPLIFLKTQNLLPDNLKGLNKISLYSQKSRCVDFFNDIMEDESVSEETNGKYSLVNSYVRSALALTKDILSFFDRMYRSFPELYNQASNGKFGRISAVSNGKSKRAPFNTFSERCTYDYPYGFFYPIIAGLTSLMEIDDLKKEVYWRINPMFIELDSLDLSQYANIIKLVNFDPQKIGKTEAFYKEGESIFEKIATEA